MFDFSMNFLLILIYNKGHCINNTVNFDLIIFSLKTEHDKESIP